MTHLCGRFVQSVALVVPAILLAAVPGQPQAGATPAERMTALKAAMAASQKQLRQYEWIETTTVSVKGEEKSRKQQRCYYGADGVLQKVPLGSDQAAAAGGGRRRGGGRLREAVVENKKEELQDYMERAASLVHHYVPPSSDRLDAARAAGTVAVRPAAGGASVGLEISDYLKAGDRLTIDVSPADTRLVGLAVASYLDAPDDAVTLGVRFDALPDGTIYAAQSTLDAPARHVRVVVQNSGYRPAAR
jgi:hypothetical protein